MVIIISEFGIKIKNISAGTLYDVNLGTRDYFSYTEAMLNNSLFSAFLIKNGLNVYKGESTRDIICLDFDFGTRSYEDEHKRIEQLYKNSDGELKERLKYTLEKVENNKDLYDEKKREQIRDKFYNEGVDVTYKTNWSHESGFVGAVRKCICFIWDKEKGLKGTNNIVID